jgi:hypothetical protein
MSSPTKRRASSTNSGRARNDESTRGRKLTDSERGMGAEGRKTGQGKKAPAATAAKQRS